MNPLTEEIADRLRHLLMDDPNISERKMFGGICFMLNNNMLCGPTNTGKMMFRVGKEHVDEALAKPHTGPMDFTGRPMKAYIFVEPEGFETDQQLLEWVAFATNFVGTLPPK